MGRNEENAIKAAARAGERAPGEVWMEVSEGIYIALSRLPQSPNQVRVLEKELSQARILAARGHVVYLLPEIGPQGMKHPDAVVDGSIMEFKTITGSIKQVEEHLRASRKKAESVFLKIDSDLSHDDVLRKLMGTVRSAGYSGGVAIVHFTRTGKTFYWSIDRMR